MINYVNNAYDKVLKPCDAQKFMELTQSEQTEKLILGHRAGEHNSKAKLPALTYMGVLDSEKYKKYLRTPSSSPSMGRTQSPRKLGSRKAEFMRPTGLLMMDFDHHPNPRTIYDTLLSCLSSDEIAPASVLALAHITPSGDGLRLVLKREKGKSIEQEQYEWFKRIEKHHEGKLSFDDVCKDISRLSFAPMQKEILYFNPSLLFGELPEASDYPDGSLWGGAELRASLGTPPPLQGTHDSVVQGTALPSLSTAWHLANPLKASFAINRGGVGEASTHPEGMQPTNCPSVYRGTSTECGGSSKQSAEQYPTDYNGIEYDEIIKRLEEQLGGRPERGARNSFIFTMACNLRYICDDNAAWVASILPTYGEDAQKHRQTIQSAINRPMSREMPETLKRALGVAKLCADADSNCQLSIVNCQLAPEMPKALPEPLRLLASRTPDKMKPAVAMGVFPSLGAYVKGLHLVYADGRHYEPTFMNVLVAEQSAGKSAVNTPVDYILADMKVRDEVHLHQEMEWKDKCARISNTQDKPARPKGLVVQILPSDMTNAAFVQRLADAEGHFLYTRMDEVELLNALKTNGASNMVSAVLRLAFDCGEYGQVRVAANAINAMVRVRWNWNASSTVQRVRKYFAKNIADGTLSRLSFSTILEDDEDWGEEMPVYEEYGTHFADDLLRYIDRLKTSTGVLRCPEAVAWAVALNRELVSFAREADDRSYARLSRRGILMGFFRAMLLYVMNGMQWSEEIEAFATWSVKYDLWCKMRFFRDMLHSDIEGERTALQRGPVGLLSMLPKEFTREDVKALRIAQGMKPNPSDVLAQWVKRGVIVRDCERGIYVKRER